MTAAILALPLTSRAGLVDRLVRSIATAADVDEANAILRRALDRESESLRRQQVPPARIRTQLGALERAVRKRLWSEIILRPDPPAPPENRPAAALLLYPSIRREKRISELAVARASSDHERAKQLLLDEVQREWDRLLALGIDDATAEDDLVNFVGLINARTTSILLRLDQGGVG
ncbi:MAG: DUF6074 family protein [Xanthobacteraceae bacterium]